MVKGNGGNGRSAGSTAATSIAADSLCSLMLGEDCTPRCNRSIQECPCTFRGLLYDQHFPSLLSFVRQRVQSRADAEDLTQDAFLKSLQFLRCEPQVSCHPPTCPFPAFAHTVARNVVRDYWRAENRKKRNGDEGLVESQEDFRSVEEALITILAVRSALEKLPERTRAVLVLYYLLGLSIPEVAEFLGATVPATHKQFQRSKQQMRELLERDGFGEGGGEAVLRRSAASSPPRSKSKREVLEWGGWRPHPKGK